MMPAIRSRVAIGVLAVGALLCSGRSAGAYPLLQLDISNGIYDSSTDTTVATAKTFTLYAYLTPANNTSASELSALLADNYYIAAALTPQVSTQQSLGTFKFNNTTVNATADMVYGDPPLEGYIAGINPGSGAYDPGDLSKHGIYNTYFKEFSFKFNANQRANAYDVQTSSANAPTSNANGDMYYMAFQVDTSLLSPNYQVHFDMYSEKLKNGDIDVNKFAPFSHDAQSWKFTTFTGHAVPEPASLVLLGTGVVLLVARRRRQR